MFDDLGVLESLSGLPKENLNRIDRRNILKMGMVGVLGAVVPLMPARSAKAAANFASWRVAFRHAHTGESFSGVYRVGDKYLPEAFERLNYVLRDHRSHEVFPMDPRVIDLMSIVQQKMRADKPMHVLSGYRSPGTNAKLRRASSGVAKNSLHMYGQALDIRQPDAGSGKLRKVALGLKAGGVGYYPRSNFVHIDTGAVRSW